MPVDMYITKNIKYIISGENDFHFTARGSVY